MDCVRVLQLTDNEDVNVINVVLPVLICQIDGISKEYASVNTEERIDRKEWYRNNAPKVLSERLDNLISDSESQARTFSLRGKERIKNPVEIFTPDTRSIVNDLDDYGSVIFASHDLESASRAHCLNGV